MSSEEKIMCVFLVIFILIALGVASIRPYFEARTFNRCTGSNATYMDAVFTQLRAVECKK